MNKIEPISLKGARTYFTGFDNKSYITDDKNKKMMILKRTLKILLLTKNKIVFGASHLKNDLAHDMINLAPEIFEKEIVVPALRNEHNGNLHKAVANDNLNLSIFTSYVGWDLQDNTKWYKERLYDGFKYENSLLQNNLKHTSKKNIQKITELLDNNDYFDRDISDREIKELLHTDDLITYDKYQNLIYNTSGARVVNCESSLDQENMIYDYSLTDIEKRKTFLSDVEIFHRIFVEQVLNSLDRSKASFSLAYIDDLQFNDIIDLRENINNTNFIEKYNTLINKSEDLVKQKDYIDFYSLQEMLQLSNELHENFKKHIELDAHIYLKNKQQYIEDKSWQEPLANVTKSLVPGLSHYDDMGNLIYLFKNSYNVLTKTKEEDLQKWNLERYANIAQDLAKNTHIENGTSLVDIFKLLQEYHYKKYQSI